MRLSRAGAYRAAGPDARPWLFGIANNLLRGHARREAAMYRAYARTGSTRRARRRRIRARLRRGRGRVLARALAKMRTEHREALLLYAVAELSYEEVATALDVPVGTVKGWLTAAARRDPASRRGGIVPDALERRRIMSDIDDLLRSFAPRRRGPPRAPTSASSHARAALLRRRPANARSASSRRPPPDARAWRLGGGAGRRSRLRRECVVAVLSSRERLGRAVAARARRGGDRVAGPDRRAVDDHALDDDGSGAVNPHRTINMRQWTLAGAGRAGNPHLISEGPFDKPPTDED